MGITKRAQYKVFNGTDFDTINFQSEAENHSLYRQAIINGNFDVWQRGTAFNFVANVTPASPYTADRWFMTKVYGDTLSVTRQAFAVGQIAVPNNPRFFLRSTYGSGTGKSVNIVQRIEGLPFSGMPITISFWAKSNTSNQLNILFEQYYSSGVEDGWSTKSVTLTTTWTQYTYTLNAASSIGRVIDDNICNSTLILQAGFANANDYVDIAQVQLNAGTTALPFSPKSYAQELLDCQRYYELASINTLVGNTQVNGITLPLMYMFKARKRVNPTISFSSTGGSNVDSTAPIVYAVTQDMATCYKTNTNNVNGWSSWYSTMSVDAEL
ncbi:hypothetical protein CSC2_30890 [Clostridium zeae]|uniref:CBM-cenC domain-containing protein n=1 Tax=Clostridium zeae TaxID=2759022 RepID=A0ABQ1ECY3_9CLOT|nr:hypothetical protein [Clostridium zeae]GFZ32563.1 hypothetical protein CSC2_30890 [Clostridium zeae]